MTKGKSSGEGYGQLTLDGDMTVVPFVNRPSLVIGVEFISPLDPTLARLPGKQFQAGLWAAPLDDLVSLLGLTGMFLLPTGDDVYLLAPGRGSPQLATSTKKQ